MKNKLIIAGLLLISALCMTACGKKDTAFADSYVVGLDDTFAPMGFRDDKGELVGFDIELATEAAKIMKASFSFQPIDWTTKEQELAGKNIDFIWNGFTITPERERVVRFSKPYLENRQIIVVMADSDISSKADLAGRSITVQGESSALTAVRKDAEFINSLAKPPVEFATNLECFADVETGRSDAIVVDEVLARYYMMQQGSDKYRVLEEHFGNEFFAVGMRMEDEELCARLDAALDELKANGKYQEIYDKWFK